MNIFTKVLKQENEKQELEEKQRKEMRQAKNIKTAEQLQPLYDEFNEALKDIYIPKRELNHNVFEQRPVFKKYRDWGHGRKLDVIEIGNARIEVCTEVENAFKVSIDYASRNEATGLSADEVRTYIAKYIVNGLRRGKYKRHSDDS